MQTKIEFAVRLARQVGNFLKQNFNHSGTKAVLKKDRSVLTEVDLAADRMIAAAIQENFPKDGYISEELQPAISSRQPAIWVVDPLDGTTNYSLGLPLWGVSIARLVDGWPDLAAIYFPPLDELYSAQRGAGAYLNGSPITVKPESISTTASFFSCCSRTFRHYDVQIPYKPRILGSAAYSLCSVGRGIALLAFEATPKLWDLAGGWLVVQEAGGVIEPLHGPPPFPVDLTVDYSQESFPTLAAASPELALTARGQILPRSP